MTRRTKALIAGLLIGMAGVLATFIPFILNLEEGLGLNLLFKIRGVREAPSETVLISLDEISAHNLNLPLTPDTWPRYLHAQITEKLVKKGAKVIAFCMTFDETRSSEYDNLFAEKIKNAGNVVLCEYMKKETINLNEKETEGIERLYVEKMVPPIPVLARSAVALAPFVLPKIPSRVNQCWKFKTGIGDRPTLPIIVFQIFAMDVYDEFIYLLERVSPAQADNLPHDKDTIMKTKNVENLINILREIFKKNPLIAEKMLNELQNSNLLSTDIKRRQILKSLIKIYQGDESMYLNFYGYPGTVKNVSYYQLLQSGENSNAHEELLDFNGKVVFVGLSNRFCTEQYQGFYTVFSQENGLNISGTEIVATAFANLLEDMPIRPLDFRAHIAFIFFWGLIIGILCFLLPSIFAALGVIIFSSFYLAFTYHQFVYMGTWYPLIMPLFLQMPVAYFGIFLWKYFEVNKERQNIKEAFGYYLRPNIVDQLAKNIDYMKSGSQMVFGTCLFTDAQQYTTLAESMEPEDLSKFMNKYYEALFKPVKLHGGFVSKVVGDSMLALWVTTKPDSTPRNQACLAALDISQSVQSFNQPNDNLNLLTRIGLHSGYMALGNIGAVDHYEYTPIGDMINTSSRIEGLNKYLGTQILVSEEVLDKLDGFLTRELGKFLLLGKSKPVVLYELICRVEESSEQQRGLCSTFSEALNDFRKQSWEEAINRFNELTQIHGKDGPSFFYLNLCNEYRDNSPGEMWDGLISFDNK